MTSIEVMVRIQPPSSHLIHKDDNDNHTLHCLNKDFYFDNIFDENATQEQVFQKVGTKLICNTLLGFNSSIFIYGQTGSGKTYTMTGKQSTHSSIDGIVQNSLKYLWKMLEKKDSFNAKVSYLQIYNQTVLDLLSDKHYPAICVREDLRQGFYAEGLKQLQINKEQEFDQAIKKGLLHRTTKETKMNAQSSRSHSVLTVHIQIKERSQDGLSKIKSSKINFVDLAGSQKQKSTECTGQRLKQAANINKSLTQLSIVISKLSENNNKHIPYRDSVLTKLLKDSISGNSKTVLIAAVSSKEESLQQTLSTLLFAQKAKKVKIDAKINEQTVGDNQFKKLNKQLADKIVLLQNQLKQKQLKCQELQQKIIQMQQKICLQKPHFKSSIEVKQIINQTKENQNAYQDFIKIISDNIKNFKFDQAQKLFFKGQNYCIQTQQIKIKNFNQNIVLLQKANQEFQQYNLKLEKQKIQLQRSLCQTAQKLLILQNQKTQWIKQAQQVQKIRSQRQQIILKTSTVNLLNEKESLLNQIDELKQIVESNNLYCSIAKQQLKRQQQQNKQKIILLNNQNQIKINQFKCIVRNLQSQISFKTNQILQMHQKAKIIKNVFKQEQIDLFNQNKKQNQKYQLEQAKLQRHFSQLRKQNNQLSKNLQQSLSANRELNLNILNLTQKIKIQSSKIQQNITNSIQYQTNIQTLSLKIKTLQNEILNEKILLQQQRHRSNEQKLIIEKLSYEKNELQNIRHQCNRTLQKKMLIIRSLTLNLQNQTKINQDKRKILQQQLKKLNQKYHQSNKKQIQHQKTIHQFTKILNQQQQLSIIQIQKKNALIQDLSKQNQLLKIGNTLFEKQQKKAFNSRETISKSSKK